MQQFCGQGPWQSCGAATLWSGALATLQLTTPCHLNMGQELCGPWGHRRRMCDGVCTNSACVTAFVATPESASSQNPFDKVVEVAQCTLVHRFMESTIHGIIPDLQSTE